MDSRAVFAAADATSARWFRESRATDFRQTQGVGTPHYMAPEQVGLKANSIDTHTDVWALGATLYEALTLEKPFPGADRFVVAARVLVREPEDPRTHSADIPKDLAAVVLKALQKRARDRYPTAEEFAADLQAWLDGNPVSARLPSAAHLLRSWTRQHPVVSAAFVLAVGLAALTGVLLAGRVSAERLAERALHLQADVALAVDGVGRDAAEGLLEAAAQRARTEFAGHPGQVAGILDRTASLAQANGLHEMAVELLRESMGLHGASQERSHGLAASLLALARGEEALDAVEAALLVTPKGSLSGALRVQRLDAILSLRDGRALRELEEAEGPALPQLLRELESVERDSELPAARIQLTLALYHLLRDEFQQAEPYAVAAFYELPRIEGSDDEVAAHLERSLHALARVDAGLGRRLSAARRFAIVHNARVERWGQADPRALRVLLDQAIAEFVVASKTARGTLLCVIALAEPDSELRREASEWLARREPTALELDDRTRLSGARFREDYWRGR